MRAALPVIASSLLAACAAGMREPLDDGAARAVSVADLPQEDRGAEPDEGPSGGTPAPPGDEASVDAVPLEGVPQESEPSAVEEAAAALSAADRTDRWRFGAAAYFWVFALDGTKERENVERNTSSNLGDTLDFIDSSLDRGLMGHVEASHGDWTVFLDSEFLDFSGDGTAEVRGRTLDVEYDFSMRLVEVGAAARIGRFDGAGGREGAVEILGGARWTDSEIDVEAASGGARASAGRGNEWVDGFVGARARIPVAAALDLTLRGDVGGLGIGESSVVSWNAVAGLDVRFSERLSLLAGYRWYWFDRESAGTETMLKLEGPFLGIALRF